MIILKNTFKKTERLNSKLLIEMLFADGKSFFIYPFRVKYIICKKDDGLPVQILISVPKKIHKSAVDRNRIKRLTREAYRKNKYILYDNYKVKDNEQLLLSIIYSGKTIASYSDIERKLILILHSLIKKNEEYNR